MKNSFCVSFAVLGVLSMLVAGRAIATGGEPPVAVESAEAGEAQPSLGYAMPKAPGLSPTGTVLPADPGGTPPTRGDVLITCSVDKKIIPGNSVACSGGGVTTANEFARCFDGVTYFPVDMDVNSLDFGVEVAEDGGNPNLVTVTLYSIAACGGVQLLDADLTMLADCSGTIDLGINGSANGTIQTVSFTGCKVPADTNVVAEIAYGDGTRIWPGSNANGQSCLSYIAADACGLPALTDLAAIGFPNVHLVLNLDAHAPDIPTLTEWGMIVLTLTLLGGLAIKFGWRRARFTASTG